MSQDVSAPRRADSAIRRVLPAVLADGVAVLAFAAIGRRSHGESDAVLGVLSVAWPFLVGAVVGWLVARGWRSPVSFRVGVVVWAATWALGMALRGVSGGGLAWSFLLVAAIALAVLLLGWRTVVVIVGRRDRA